MDTLRAFIGSSSEGRELAETLQAALSDNLEVEVWDQGVFTPGLNTLDDLLRIAGSHDLAILLLTPDDVLAKRGESGRAPRDNVLFELGLFMGALGRRRVFAVCPRSDTPILPTDLLGVNLLFYEARVGGNLRAQLNPCALRIRQAARELGTRPLVGASSAGLSIIASVNDEDNREVAERIRRARRIDFMAHTGYHAFVSMYQAPFRLAIQQGARIRIIVSAPDGSVLTNEALRVRICPSINQGGEILEVIAAARRHLSAATKGGQGGTIEVRLYQGVPHENLLILDAWLRAVPYLPLVDAAESPVIECTKTSSKEAAMYFDQQVTSFESAWADSDSYHLED